MTITITYLLTETGRKAALLAGARGHETVTIEGDALLTAERLALLEVGTDGRAKALALRGRHLEPAYLNTYHAEPEQLLAELERIHAERSAGLAVEAAKDAAELTRQVERWLLDGRGWWSGQPALPAGHPLTEQVATKTAREEAERDARRATEAAERDARLEARAREQAEALAASAAKLAQLAAHIREHGTPDERARLAEPGGPLGVLPTAEAEHSLREYAMLAIASEASYVRLQATDIDHEEDCDSEEATYGAETVDAYPAAVYARVLALRSLLWPARQVGQLAPGCQIEVREHTAHCTSCGEEATRYGVVVEVSVGAYRFRRELGV